MTVLRALIALPFLVLLVAFALSNQQPVQLVLWPTDISLEVPLSIAVLAISAVFFLAGALLVWGSTLAVRGRARRAEETARQLRHQVEALRAQQGRPAMALPPPG